MLLSIDELVKILRSSVNVQYEDGTDPAYLKMSDDDIKLFIKLGISRAYPKIEDFDELPSGSEYPVVLLAKIELYLKLAVVKADKVDMGADSAYLKQDQRFQHYMKLAEEAKSEYESWLDNEGEGEVTSYNVLLGTRHFTNFNYKNQPTPKVRVKIDLLTQNEVNYHFSVTDTSKFGRFKVFVSDKPIFNAYKGDYSYMSRIDKEAKLVVSTSNIRNTSHSLSNLEAGKEYYMLVLAIEMNQIYGYQEISFTTPMEEEEISESSL